MKDLENLNGFLNALGDQLEGAKARASDPSAFLAATRAIEKLLVDDWPAVEANLNNEDFTADDRQRVVQIIESISELETKTHARLAWTQDFEKHMRRAMETIS